MLFCEFIGHDSCDYCWKNTQSPVTCGHQLIIFFFAVIPIWTHKQRLSYPYELAKKESYCFEYCTNVVYLFDSFLVDERSLGSSRGDAIPDLQILLHGSSQFLDKFIINTFVYINPVGTHTGLKENEVEDS